MIHSYFGISLAKMVTLILFFLTYGFLAESTLHFSTSKSLKTDCNTMCEGDKKALNLYYNDILEAQKDDNVLIIDVREQSEIDETGKLPGSIHIPSVYIYMLYL